MIYAGVDRDDQRVKAALSWIRKNYDVSQNPGMGASGHYYYLHTFAKTLRALEINEVQSADGQRHNWRGDLISELSRRQKRNGSWFNTRNTRWLEGDENLVTGYALLALSYCRD
jgi:squalene-hopene/tetraprenyl-beta-curcumene cyclase